MFNYVPKNHLMDKVEDGAPGGGEEKKPVELEVNHEGKDYKVLVSPPKPGEKVAPAQFVDGEPEEALKNPDFYTKFNESLYNTIVKTQDEARKTNEQKKIDQEKAEKPPVDEGNKAIMDSIEKMNLRLDALAGGNRPPVDKQPEKKSTKDYLIESAGVKTWDEYLALEDEEKSLAQMNATSAMAESRVDAKLSKYSQNEQKITLERKAAEKAIVQGYTYDEIKLFASDLGVDQVNEKIVDVFLKTSNSNIDKGQAARKAKEDRDKVTVIRDGIEQFDMDGDLGFVFKSEGDKNKALSKEIYDLETKEKSSQTIDLFRGAKSEKK